jgi:hypothetical protein
MESHEEKSPDSIKGQIFINAENGQVSVNFLTEAGEVIDWDERMRAQQAENTIKYYAEVSALDLNNKSLINSYTNTFRELYSTWKKQNTQKLNFEKEIIRFSREFRKLINAFPDDAAELADAFCLNIRNIIDEISDTFRGRHTSSYKGPKTPQTDISAPGATEILNKWMAELRSEEEEAISELLYGPHTILPPLEGETYTHAYKEALRKQAFRHQFHATISLYQYARELYEKHLPKQFARRVNLPAFYTVPPVAIVAQTSSQAPTFYNGNTADAINIQATESVGQGVLTEALAPRDLTDPRDPSNIDYLFAKPFTTELCDTLAEQVGLCPPNEVWRTPSFGKAKIWAIVSLLKQKGLLKGNQAQTGKPLAKRYGFTVADRHYKQSGGGVTKNGEAYITAQSKAREALNKMKENPPFI